MKNTSYDLRGADRLIPLLRSVQREIRERGNAVRSLRLRLANTEDANRTPDEALATQAAISEHRRQIRHAQDELARLGCSIDQQDPHRVLIPSASGQQADAFSWSFGESQVRPVVGGADHAGSSERAA